jgi:hypothetical protein
VIEGSILRGGQRDGIRRVEGGVRRAAIGDDVERRGPPIWCSQVIVCELSVDAVATLACSASARFGVSSGCRRPMRWRG